jgi:Xaa-Pro aminopeptidase
MATERVALTLRPGFTELEIAQRLQSELASHSITEQWYPTLVCAGANTGKPLSRRFHLPSADTKVRENDIVIVDSTPLRHTVWGNWGQTVSIGGDPFFHNLSLECLEIAEETLAFGKHSAETIGDLFEFCMNLIEERGLKSLDPRNDVGHSIFPVPLGQTVEDTPLKERLFISKEYADYPLRGIISIEPQVGRVHPKDGILYGAKQQRVLIKSAAN